MGDQINRMEGKLNAILEALGEDTAVEDEANVLLGFYEEEIVDEEGSLHHLANDKKVKELFEKISEEEDVEEEDENMIDEGEEFKNEPIE